MHAPSEEATRRRVQLSLQDSPLPRGNTNPQYEFTDVTDNPLRCSLRAYFLLLRNGQILTGTVFLCEKTAINALTRSQPAGDLL